MSPFRHARAAHGVSGSLPAHGQRSLKAEADDGGRLDLPGIPATGWIIFTHPQGYLEAGAADLPADGTVRLGAYGAVEGDC